MKMIYMLLWVCWVGWAWLRLWCWRVPFQRCSAWFGAHWLRFQGRLAGFYFRRVGAALRFWRACGSPAGFAPRVPWWAPFFFVLLRALGAVPPPRRPRRSAR